MSSIAKGMAIDEKYMHWIRDNVPRTSESLYDVRGHCKKFSEMMQAQFPELQVMKGFYTDRLWGEQQHWWCEVDGMIVDPTAHQFPTKGNGEYRALQDHELPIGKCINCGNLCYQGAPCEVICSQKCQAEIEKDGL